MIVNQKFTRSGELRRVLGVSAGSALEGHPFGVSHPKPVAPVASGELQHFKESVQYASRKARDRANMFRESISELEKYTEALTSKKRQRADLSSERGGGVNLTKMGSQLQKTNIDNLTQRSDSKTSNSTLSKRIRTSLADTREDSRSAAIGRHQMVTEKDRNPIQTLGGGSVRNEEKTRRLLAGGDGLDQKIKKKRSVGTGGNRVITGERDVKRATLPKANTDPKMRFFDSQSFRLKSLPGFSGSSKSEGSSDPTSAGALTMLANEQEGASLRMDHITERRVVAKGNSRANIQEDCPLISSSTLIKNKVSRAPRTSSVSALDLPSSETFPGSSIHPMTQWVGQRPLKNSRSRRVKIVSPVSRTLEIQVSSEGCLTFDSTVKASAGHSGFQMASSIENITPKYKKTPDDISSPFGLSGSGESRAGENKIEEKGVNSNNFAMAAEKAGPSMLQMRRNKILTDESGDYVQKQGRNGRGLSLIKPGLPSGREKTENLPISRPVQDMRPNDKSKIKYGRPASKKQKGRKVWSCVGKQLNIDSSDFGEDESEGSCYQSEAKNISRQCASDDSHCGSCNQIDFESKGRDRMDSEVESNTFRYPNTSSSLQSPGVWQGDEEFFISDITHTGEICSNDLDQVQPAEFSVPCFPSTDGQYQMMSLDDRLLLELQSIGLYPEILPDLAEEDEVINQDILKLEKALCEQNGRKTKKLDKIDKAIEKGRDMERRTIEQVAFDQLIEIAYRKRLACRGSKNSKGAIQKVSKQVSLAFVNRTLGRCRRYEVAGISCFSEPALQNIMFSRPSHENDAQPMDCIVSGTASNTFNKASHLTEAIKSVSSASEKYDRHRDDLDRGLLDSFQGSIRLSEQAPSKNGSVFIKEKKREMLVNCSTDGSSSRASNLDGAVHGGVKGKRSDRERNQSRDQIRESSDSRGGRLSLDSSRSQNKAKAKPEQKSTAGGHQDRSITATESVAGTRNNGSKDGIALSGNQDTSKVKKSVDFVNLPLDDLSSIDEFGVAVTTITRQRS
ncbi:unnamed protein product [Lupinus luteus]|uniref:Uncharacterized protein n=1 Tax=Lupinus luteus TaxID=3873 RepID=A0AAV1Y4W9_LUPLU